MACIAVPFMVNPEAKTFRVLIAMDDEAHSRVRKYDPAEVPFVDMFTIPELAGYRCDGVAITSISAEEMKWVTTAPLPTLPQIVQKLYRGYTFDREKGDGKPTEMYG